MTVVLHSIQHWWKAEIAGSVYMGWAEAVTEEQAFAYGGPNPGLLRGPSLLDYRIPTSVETPDIECIIIKAKIQMVPMAQKRRVRGPCIRFCRLLPMLSMMPSGSDLTVFHFTLPWFELP